MEPTPDPAPESDAAEKAASRWRFSTATAIVSAVSVGTAVLFVLSVLEPGLLTANTTTSGGDMGAHVWTPAYLRDNLLPKFRVTGWTPDWYAGFPALTFYFPLPSLLIVILDLFLPYNVAFKLVTVSGVLTLPIAAWAFGKLSGLRFPTPAMLGLATLPFLFDQGFTIYGGNIASTMAGEFSFSMSLSLGLLFLGFLARGLENGRHRALAAALLAATALCHVIPTFFVLAASLVLIVIAVVRHGWSRLTFAFPTFVVGGLLAAFWMLPFVVRSPYMNDMGWEKLENYLDGLFPGSLWYVYALAVVGAAFAVAAAVLDRRTTGLFIVIMAIAAAAAFRFVPQTRLWNARLLPFWFLSLHLLAGFGLGEAAVFGSRALRWLRRRVLPQVEGDASVRVLERLPRLVAPAFGLVYVLMVVAPPVGAVPDWLPVKQESSFVPGWVKWNYEGYEGKPAYPEYADLIATMERVGGDHGCGRAMWEYEPELDRLGTPMALMLLPYWTDGCIGSMEGLFFESSATVPYHFLTQSELSIRPSRPQRDLAYGSLDVVKGVEHLQMLGVRYYMAISEEAKQQARENADLTLIASSGPWSVDYTENNQTVRKERTWEVFLVARSALVAPLPNEPVVVESLPGAGRGWLEVAERWYNDPARWAVPLAADGPGEWRRVARADDAIGDPLRPVRVSRVRSDDDDISFDVSRPGVPVVVRTSYFPNWKAKGARGPWRITPNLMVVIPTERHVALHYGSTGVDIGAWVLTAIGIAGTAALAWRGRVSFPASAPRVGPAVAGEPDGATDERTGERPLVAVLDDR